MGMSASTALHPIPVQENQCKCGHGYYQHNPGTLTTATCQGCIAAGNLHIHQFTGIWEPEPSLAFQNNNPRGYYVSGGLGTYLPSATITSGVGNNAGVTTVTVVSTTGAVVGGVAEIGGPLPQFTEDYEIIQIISATQFKIPAPGLTFNYGAGQNVAFLGRRGSMMGAGLPANGQRAG